MLYQKQHQISPYLKFTYAPEFLLNEKLITLDNYFKYLDTACEFAKVDKVQVIEIVRIKNSYKRWAQDHFMRFIEYDKKMVTRGEKAGGTVVNYYRAFKLFCEMNDLQLSSIIIQFLLMNLIL